MGSETGSDFPYSGIEYRLKRGWVAEKDMTEADKQEWLESALGPSVSVEIANG